LKKHDIIEGRVEEYDFPNKGSFTYEDRKITVKGAFKGQKIRCAVTKLKKGKAEARLLEVLEKSPMEDGEICCSHFGKCGGCTYQTFSYERQLEIKEAQVKKLLDEAIAYPYEWEGIVPSPLQHGYRNKMEFSFGDEYKDGPLALGLHKKNSTYDIVSLKDCDIVSEDYNKIIQYTQDFYSGLNLPYYKKMQHTGLLRHLVVRQSYTNRELLVNLVTSTDGMEKLELSDYVNGLLKLPLNGKLAGILHTENDSLSDTVACDKMNILYGDKYIYEEILGLRFKISPFSFFQTNTKSAERLYEKAREYVGDTKDKVVFDLYSGTGTIAQMLAPVAKQVVGVEIVEEAVEAARVNAELNHLSNCHFIAGDVLKVIDDIEEKPDIIVLDPPRDGIHPKAIGKIIDFGVDELVYISCKPTSLARDLQIFNENGYRVKKACAVDQFPSTVHVEAVALLVRERSDRRSN
jgi:23S rRNA (uracil-5-)-methyltransferase RumA